MLRHKTNLKEFRKTEIILCPSRACIEASATTGPPPLFSLAQIPHGAPSYSCEPRSIRTFTCHTAENGNDEMLRGPFLSASNLGGHIMPAHVRSRIFPTGILSRHWGG